MNDDVHYRLLKVLEERPDASQRELAQTLGISLGRINYCVKALIDQGWIKATNFKNSKNKLAYAYLLTPSDIDAKTRITARFLKRKIAEYAALKEGPKLLGGGPILLWDARSAGRPSMQDSTRD